MKQRLVTLVVGKVAVSPAHVTAVEMLDADRTIVTVVGRVRPFFIDHPYDDVVNALNLHKNINDLQAGR